MVEPRWLTKFAEKITRRIDDHENRLRGVERKPQLHRAALHNGSIDEYASGKKLVSVIGKQFDGGHGVVVTSDPVPPVSSPANVVAGPESIAVQVPGTFMGTDENGNPVTDLTIPSPTYFSRYEIHVSTDPNFSAMFADTLKGTIDSPRGAWYVVSPLPADVPHYVRIVVRSLSGKASEPSAVVEVTPRPKLQPGDLDGKHITGTTFMTRNSRGMWSDDGLFIFREDGTRRIALPTDDESPYIDAELIARSLSVLGAASFQGETEIASGSPLVIAAGVTPPVSPPPVSMTYPTAPLPALPESRASVHGLAYANFRFWRAVNVWDSTNDRLEALGISDGEGVITETISTPGGGPVHGVTAVNGILYMLYTSPVDGDKWVRGMDAVTKRSVSHWEYTADTGGPAPAIGTDGTNVVIAQCWPAGNVSWRTYDPGNGVVVDDQWSNYKLSSDLVGVHVGAADYGTEHVTITKSNGTTEIFLPDGTHIPYGGWYGRNREDHVGMCWDGSNFRGLTASGTLVEYSNIWDLGGDTNDWWLGSTWADGTGNETTIGKPQQFTLTRRATLTVGAPNIPNGATETRLYLARKATQPIPEEFNYLAAATGVTQLEDIDGWETGAQPPAVNEIPDSQPGWITSQRGAFYVDGAGNGYWGPLHFAADGSMTVDHPIERLVGAVGEPAFLNGYANYTTIDNPLRFWKDTSGKVWLSGSITGYSNGNPIFTLPPGFEPRYEQSGTLAFWQGATPAAFGEIKVYTNGNVVFWRSGNDAGTYISIGDMSWVPA